MEWFLGGKKTALNSVCFIIQASSNEEVTSLKLRHEPFGNRDNSHMWWIDFYSHVYWQHLLWGINNTCETNGTLDTCNTWLWNYSYCCIHLDHILGRSDTWVVLDPSAGQHPKMISSVIHFLCRFLIECELFLLLSCTSFLLWSVAAGVPFKIDLHVQLLWKSHLEQ